MLVWGTVLSPILKLIDVCPEVNIDPYCGMVIVKEPPTVTSDVASGESYPSTQAVTLVPVVAGSPLILATPTNAWGVTLLFMLGSG